MNSPKTMLHLESLALLLATLVAYQQLGLNGWLFLALLFVPDASMVGYLANERIGSMTYNMVHTFLGPLVLVGIGLAGEWELGISIALIWVTHIALDRTLGYGLKYPTAFKDTHLQRV
ncbi:MAG: DUF4260 domain-containing protein [Anaerolineales bacterium]|nr:DUF4260 domain-containing protein [Anaerolineales bacterium]